MAQVDVTELLSDPDFVDSLMISHRQSVVNEAGENVVTEQKVFTIGSVQPASGKTLARLPDDLRVADVSSFWVKGKIIADGKCTYPDVLTFMGQCYEVQTVLDYSNWGAGWCEGTCVRRKPS